VAAERTLTTRELNRALLARQLLLERARMTLPRALERIGGIQAQYAPSMYIGLWSRVADFKRRQLTRALERRSVIQGTLLRSTIHLVSARDYWPLAVAVRDGRRRWWLRVQADPPTERELNAAATSLRTHMRAGPLPRAEIEQLVGKRLLVGVNLWLELVRVPPSGTWERRRADRFHTAEEWLGPPRVSLDDAVDHLVRRYLGGFGPASANDIAAWAGIPLAGIEPALERLPLRRFQTEAGEELLDLPRAPLPDPDTPAPPRYLPTWDATLLAHARRTGILPERHRLKVFNTKMPQSVPTFLVDGVVAGIWRYDGGRVRLEPFEALAPSTRRELTQEAKRLAALHS
jgi:Winged helix DNA-binding domain